MSPSQKLKELKEVIVKAVPDVVGKPYCKSGCGCDYDSPMGSKLHERECVWEWEERHITLEDVLTTINKKDIRNEYGDKEFVNIVNNGMVETNLYNWEEEPLFWSLGKSLDLQPQPTIDFLWEVLVNKK